MKYCKKCLMPDTRPGLIFTDGVCLACLHAEQKFTETNYDQRWKELEELCDKYRGKNGDGYDCAIAVSGGKDSHTQVYTMKKRLGMNPLLISVDNFSWTETGRKNIKNLCDTFNCDLFTFTPRMQALRILTKKASRKLGQPNWYFDSLVYAIPYSLAIKLGIELLIWGENVGYEYGGSQGKIETPSALQQFENDVVKQIDFDEWLGDGITLKDLQQCKFPTYEEMKAAKLHPIYLSYYIPWDSHKNYMIAKRFGFQHIGHEWIREGAIENYNQVDTVGYGINQFFKFIKFGHSSVTELASRWVRAGMITRDEAVKLVLEKDDKLDQKVYNDYLEFTGLSHEEFWEIADKWYNHNIFKKDRWGLWIMKENVINALKKGGRVVI